MPIKYLKKSPKTSSTDDNKTKDIVQKLLNDLEKSRDFYKNVLGCEEGRSSDHWVDFNLFGHQLVIHYKEKSTEKSKTNPVDGKDVPIPHFGVVIPWDDFDKFANMLSTNNIHFVIEPYVRFEGLPGEQKTMFFQDPFGNSLEFKSFKSDDEIFKST